MHYYWQHCVWVLLVALGSGKDALVAQTCCALVLAAALHFVGSPCLLASWGLR